MLKDKVLLRGRIEGHFGGMLLRIENGFFSRDGCRFKGAKDNQRGKG